MTTAAIAMERGMATPSFGRFCFRVSACHIATYTIAGILAYFLLDYRTFFQTGLLGQYMRPLDSKWVAAGPGLQVIRGIIFAAALYPFRRVFLDESRGWLKLWLLIVGLALLSTVGPAPASVEGFIYTRLSLYEHVHGLSEVLFQTLAFSWLVVAWNRQPKRWLSVTVTILAVLAVVMSVLGVLAPRPQTFGAS